MYCVYGKSSWYIHGGLLFGGGPLLGGSVIGGSTVYRLQYSYSAAVLMLSSLGTTAIIFVGYL